MLPSTKESQKMEIWAVRVMVRGMTIGFTAKDARQPHLQLGFIARQIEVLRELGHGDEIEVVFYDILDKKIPCHWWIAENDTYGDKYLDYVIEDDGVADMEEGTTAYLNSRGW